MIFLRLLIYTNIMAVTVIASAIFTKNSLDGELLSYNFSFISREQWQARKPHETETLSTPVPYVVIHHSYSPPACYDGAQCQQAMRRMQDVHMDDSGWLDIGYNFGVGSDGRAYEGRGWDILGSHVLHFNTVSIGICLIGDWSDSLPPTVQLETAQALILAGIELGYVKEDYKLVGHRQVRNTECPGNTLFDEIQTWPHYSPFPASADDLQNVSELHTS